MSLPTVEQVREHAQRCHITQSLMDYGENGGLWRCNAGPDGLPMFVLLAVMPEDSDGVDTVCTWDEHYEEWEPLQAGAANLGWTPCDQSGNPLPLVQERDELRKQLDASQWVAAEQIVAAHRERDEAVAAREQMRFQVQERNGYVTEWSQRWCGKLDALTAERDEWKRKAENITGQCVACGSTHVIMTPEVKP